MILHKDCLPLDRKWLDKPYCSPFVFPWEIQLTDHFGLEHLTHQNFAIRIELVNDLGMPAGDITMAFDITIGKDSSDRNVFVARLKSFPPSMPTSFRLMITLTSEGENVYKMVTEPYLFLNDPCVTAYTLNNTDWARIVNGGRLIINGERYQVTITGVGLPDGLSYGMNGPRQESSIAVEAGLVYELFGEDIDGNRISFRNAGILCNSTGRDNTLIMEGKFDCLAPNGRYVGSVLPHLPDMPDVRYRVLTRIYADIQTMPSDITRTIALNNKVQRSEIVKRYQLIGYVPIPSWKKDELETLLMGSRLFIQGQEYVFSTGKPFERQAVPGTTGWWLKADLEQPIERKEYSCEVVCLTCLKPNGLSFQILPDPCDPLTGLQATVAAAPDGVKVNLTISGENIATAISFKIGYRLQGSGAGFIYVNPDPITLPYVIPGLPNGVYEVEVTKRSQDDVCPPLVAVSNAVDLSPFDFLVVRYIWTDQDGRDLDTFTGFMNTGSIYDNDWVGYGQGDPKVPVGASDDTAYLFWASDNTQSGVEAVLMNLKQFTLDNAGIPDEVQVRMNATWWSQRISGNVQVQLTTYLGGMMSKNGYDFVNTGGTQVDQVTLNTNVATQGGGANIDNSSNVAIVRYNKNTKQASIQLI